MTVWGLCISNKVEVFTYGTKAAEVAVKRSQVRHTEKENFWRRERGTHTDIITIDEDVVFVLCDVWWSTKDEDSYSHSSYSFPISGQGSLENHAGSLCRLWRLNPFLAAKNYSCSLWLKHTCIAGRHLWINGTLSLQERLIPLDALTAAKKCQKHTKCLQSLESCLKNNENGHDSLLTKSGITTSYALLHQPPPTSGVMTDSASICTSFP